MSEGELPMVGKNSTLIRNSTLAFYLRNSRTLFGSELLLLLLILSLSFLV